MKEQLIKMLQLTQQKIDWLYSEWERMGHPIEYKDIFDRCLFDNAIGQDYLCKCIHNIEVGA